MPVAAGIGFLAWAYLLLAADHPKILIFPLSAFLFFALYYVSGPVYGGVFLFFVTVAGFVASVITHFLWNGAVFIFEMLGLWALFFAVDYYRNRTARTLSGIREEEDVLEKRIAAGESRIEEYQQHAGDLAQRLKNYQLLGNVTHSLGAALDESKILFLVEHLGSSIVTRGVWRARKKFANDIFAQYVRQHRVPLMIKNLATDNRFLVRHPRFSSLIAVPLEVNNRFVGVLKGVAARHDAFTEDDLRLLSILGGIASLAIGNARLYQKIQELSITDSLTGLYVQHYFKERLQEEIHRSRSHDLPLSVARIDIDYFKRCNDTYGHSAGDFVLRHLSALLRRRLRETDLLCRYGGEEFGIIMPQTDAAEAALVTESLRRSTEEERFFLPTKGFHPVRVMVTVSIGISTLEHAGRSGMDILAAADAALYRAKHAGRNRVEE
jgi:diguanylate cyclase (GGDEF)-like protein